VRLSVFNPRGVGAVASAHVAHDRHNGVDSDPSKQQRHEAPLVEPGLPEPADAAVTGGRLSATTDPGEADYKLGFSLICGMSAKSRPDLRHMIKNSRQILGAAGRKTLPELKPSRPWQGQLISCQLSGRHRPDQSPDAPRPVRQLLKRFLAEREARIQGWNSVIFDATVSNSGPRPTRRLLDQYLNRNHVTTKYRINKSSLCRPRSIS
jgi:hypothetical protein